MRLRTLFFLVAVVLIGAFVALNWSAFVETRSLHLGIATIEAPLGLVMLGLSAVLLLTLLAYALISHHNAQLSAGRYAQKLEAQRELTEKAEASRYVQLQEFLARELTAKAEKDEQLRGEIVERLAVLEREMHASGAPATEDKIDRENHLVAQASEVLS